MISIFKRELKGYFDSPIAYIFIVVFLLVNCGLYMSSFFLIGRLEIRSLFSLLPFVLIVFIPAITMRLWAEEKRMGTYELVLTFPLNARDIVMGKFFASLFFYGVALFGTLSIPLVLWLLGGTDPGPIIGGYLGSMLLGAFFLSVGIFISGLCKDQIIAFILAMVVSFAFFMLGTEYIATQLDGWSGPLALGTLLKKYVGMTSHFAAVERGIIDLRDMFYFLSMTVFFLALNSIYLEGRQQVGSQRRFILGAVLIGVVVVFGNVVISGFTGVRFDLTSEKIFTVSPSARIILSRLKVPVRLNLYITPEEKMPSAMKNLERDILDKLEDFRIASGGNLTYEVFDPTADPKLLEKMKSKGIVPFQVQSVEQDEIGVKVIYSAISVSYLDKKEEIIPAVHTQNFSSLEYDLISKIYKVSSEKKPRIAVFAGEEKLDPALIQLYQQMGRQLPDNTPKFNNVSGILRNEDYDVIKVEITQESPIPENVDTLLVISPKNLNERQLYEISRVVTRGGSVIFAVQNFRYNYSPLGMRGMEVTPVPVMPGINPLLRNYGVSIDEKILMDSSMETLSIPAKQKMFGMFTAVVNTPVKVPTQIKVISQTMNSDVSITSNLSVLLYLWGSALKIDEPLPEGIEARVLMTSSTKSWMIPAKSTALDIADITPPMSFDGLKPLAAMLSGQFNDPYKDKARPPWPGGGGESEGEETSIVPSPGKIIVIGAGDIFNDDFIRAGNNGLFLLNSVDALSLGDELINIRGKHHVIKMIPGTSPATKLWYKFLGVLLSPLIIISMGVIRLFIRRKNMAGGLMPDFNRAG